MVKVSVPDSSVTSFSEQDSVVKYAPCRLDCVLQTYRSLHYRVKSGSSRAMKPAKRTRLKIPSSSEVSDVVSHSIFCPNLYSNLMGCCLVGLVQYWLFQNKSIGV